MDTEHVGSPQPISQRPVWANPRVIAAAGLTLLFLIFAIQNNHRVEVNFLFWDIRLRMFILLVLSAVAGGAIWELIRYLRRRASTDQH